MPEFHLPGRAPIMHDVIFSYEHRDAEGNLLFRSLDHHLDLVSNSGLNWMSSQLAGTVSGSLDNGDFLNGYLHVKADYIGCVPLSPKILKKYFKLDISF